MEISLTVTPSHSLKGQDHKARPSGYVKEHATTCAVTSQTYRYTSQVRPVILRVRTR